MVKSIARVLAIVALAAGCLASAYAVASAQEGRSGRGIRVSCDPAWKPGPENDPAMCQALWQKIGLPTYAGSGGQESVPVCHKRYVLMHNNETRIPDWVLEHLTREQVSGDNSRPTNSFDPEPAIPECARAVDNDYKRSKFARGHQAPSEDFNVEEALMLDTFFFSNVVPQIGNGFNSGIWSTLERMVRELAKDRGELYVITGPIYQNGEARSQTITPAENACAKTIKLDPLPNTKRPERVCAASNRKPPAPCEEEGAAVPSALFKIIYDPTNERANAYVLPNIDHKELKGKTDSIAYLEKFRTTVQVVEEYTGVRFFGALSAREQRVRKQNCTATMVH